MWSVILGKTFEEHLKKLEEVFNLLIEINLKLNPEEYHFSKKQNCKRVAGSQEQNRTHRIFSGYVFTTEDVLKDL